MWFSMLLLVGNTPMDFIHQFANHHDTVHKDHKGLVIENKHHHCAYLSLTLASFINNYSISAIPFVRLQHQAKYTSIALHCVQRAVISASLRGPPAA